MRDEALTTPPQLSAAEAAVNYILQRVRVDADLRYHLLHTEAFARLCRAEAERTGKTDEEVEEHYSMLANHCKDDLPKLVKVRKAVKDAVQVCRDRDREMCDLPPWLAPVLAKLENLI